MPKDVILLAKHNLEMSPLENEISDLESRECKAIEKRDTVMLRLLWSRDFTLDEAQNEISIRGRNPIPYYTSYPGLYKTTVWSMIRSTRQVMNWFNASR